MLRDKEQLPKTPGSMPGTHTAALNHLELHFQGTQSPLLSSWDARHAYVQASESLPVLWNQRGVWPVLPGPPLPHGVPHRRFGFDYKSLKGSSSRDLVS